MDRFDNIVLSYNLQLNQFRDELTFSKELRDIEWQYENVTEREYNHDSFGFYTDDEYLARNHFFMQMRKLASQTEESQNNEERMSLIKIACEDFKNYVFACEMLQMGEKGRLPAAKRMISLILAYGGAEPLYSTIKKIYIDTLNEYDSKFATSINSDFFLDYHVIYERYGDYALFVEQNVDIALLYYELASLDWYNFEGEVEWERKDAKKKAILHSREKFQWMNRLLVSPYRICAEWERTHIWQGEDAYKKLYLTYMQKLNSESSDEITTSAVNFFRAFARMIDEKGTRESLRIPLLLAHEVRDSSLYWVMTAYATLEKKENLDEPTQRGIFDCIRTNKEALLAPIKLYLMQRNENSQTLDVCFRLLAVAAHVHTLAGLLRLNTLSGNSLAYYTSLETFSYMLPFRAEDEMVGRFSIMNIAYMNDPNEGRTLQKCLFEGEVPFEGDVLHRKNARYPYVFLKCFTPQIDFLPMWEMYGDHARGCCLVLDWNPKQKEQLDVPLYHVCYLTKEGTSYKINPNNNVDLGNCEEIESELNVLTSLCGELYATGDEACEEAVHNFLNQILYLFKEDSYAYEREVRICYQFPEVSSQFRHTSNNFGKLYVATDFPIAIKEVILGSKFDNRSEVMPFLQEQIDLLSRKCNMNAPKITLSDIEYR